MQATEIDALLEVDLRVARRLQRPFPLMMRIDVVVENLLRLYELRLAALANRCRLRRRPLGQPRGRLALLLSHCRPLLNERCRTTRGWHRDCTRGRAARDSPANRSVVPCAYALLVQVVAHADGCRIGKDALGQPRPIAAASDQSHQVLLRGVGRVRVIEDLDGTTSPVLR